MSVRVLELWKTYEASGAFQASWATAASARPVAVRRLQEKNGEVGR
jgi:hypothetical protein